MQRKRWDVLVVKGHVVLPGGTDLVDIGIRDGKIISVGPDLPEADAERVLSAEGKHVFAGVVDAHVHLNEPGLGAWEGFATGTAALAAGGCTAFIDMPLNGLPPTVNLPALELKLAAARQDGAHVDYALWGGLVPGNAGELAALAGAGVVGFKAFMSSPGDTGEGCFQHVDDAMLFEGMQAIASLGGILSLHAESEPIVSALAAQKLAAGDRTMRDYLDARPPQAELEAVKLALDMARRTGCRLHFVHISTAEAIDLISEAKRDGLDVTAETCPHYLAFTDEDVIRIGAGAKCSPPIRSAREREELWKRLAEGEIDLVASDHSPCPPSMKEAENGNYFEAWGGILGAQSTLEVVVTEGWHKRGIPLHVLSRALSAAPAERFGLNVYKGKIEIGLDADLAVVDLNAPYVLSAEQLLYKHPHSAYVGCRFGCQVEMTLLRGNIIYKRRADTGEGKIVGTANGRRLLPGRRP
ncbi:allantoinase AllB [Paenibacillus montanisoli]|uniref:Allantoinase n=1 Tax=Paenibacillus montanisoli TaxID=2081970 RepID=A0A328UA29_9BACL|nr:allantoinase AllB [Paenibacillus montanisoli]RAP77775.1 allantoinase AllB [Paenibacillus montanisoli]